MKRQHVIALVALAALLTANVGFAAAAEKEVDRTKMLDASARKVN